MSQIEDSGVSNFMSQDDVHNHHGIADHENGADMTSQEVNGGHQNGRTRAANNPNLEPEQFRKVFIGGLSYKTDDDTLKAYFAKYGDLVDHVVMKDPQSGRSRGFGFVTYSDSFMVDELMRNRPHIIDGRQVEPKRATPRERDNKNLGRNDSGRSEVQITVKKLFIGGLKDNISDDDLKAYFGNYGSVVEAVVMKDKETTKSRGFGFVSFDDYDPVDKIILEKNHTINGLTVHVQKALPKDFEKGPPGPGGPGGRPMGRNFGMGGGFGGGFDNFGGGGFGRPMPGQFDNGFGMNTYGSYNQAPNQPKMNGGMPMMGGMRGGMRGGPGGGPMRGGARFANRSAGPYDSRVLFLRDTLQ